MIHPDSRSLKWIDEIHTKHPRLDKQLIEKTIRALCLLESLACSGCPFVFNGGSCVMLHLKGSKRLSIDIDIICPPGTDITLFLHKYAQDYGFFDIKLIERKSRNGVPKSHAKFYYQVTYRTRAEEDNILLDVLYENIHYSKVETLPISIPLLLEEGEPVKVKVPSVDDILGDKLTAFAPHTTGIPFYKGDRFTSLEVIKQMFDIASLIDYVKDFNLVKQTFFKFVKVELGYRGLEHFTSYDVLEDAIQTALCLSLKGKVNPDEFELLLKGVQRLDNLVVESKYVLDRAICDAAKVAYISAMVITDESKFQSFDSVNIDDIRIMAITFLPSKLNKLKKSNVKAFYYWAMTDKLLSSKHLKS